MSTFATALRQFAEDYVAAAAGRKRLSDGDFNNGVRGFALSLAEREEWLRGLLETRA